MPAAARLCFQTPHRATLRLAERGGRACQCEAVADHSPSDRGLVEALGCPGSNVSILEQNCKLHFAQTRPPLGPQITSKRATVRPRPRGVPAPPERRQTGTRHAAAAPGAPGLGYAQASATAVAGRGLSAAAQRVPAPAAFQLARSPAWHPVAATAYQPAAVCPERVAPCPPPPGAAPAAPSACVPPEAAAQHTTAAAAAAAAVAQPA